MKVIKTLQSRNKEFARLAKRASEQRIENLRSLLFGFNLLTTFIVLIISVYIILRLVEHYKQKSKDGYLVFLNVITKISLVINIFSLLLRNPLSILAITCNVLIIIGYKAYKNQPVEQNE